VREGGEHSGSDKAGKATGRKGTGGNIMKGEHVGASGR
jgi:hypothetical protein